MGKEASKSGSSEGKVQNFSRGRFDEIAHSILEMLPVKVWVAARVHHKY